MSTIQYLQAGLGRASLVFDLVRPSLMKWRHRRRSGEDANFDKTGIVTSSDAAIRVIDEGGIRYAVYDSAAHSFWRAQELTLLHRNRSLLQAPVLDFGCGDGCFAQAAFGQLDIGVDNDPEALAAAARRGVYRQLVQSSASRIDLPDASVGTVVSNSVLEHLTDLDQQLQEFYRIIKPGGRLIFTAPTSVYTEHLSFYFGRTEADQINKESVHNNLLSAAEWSFHCRSAGFSIETVKGYQSAYFTYCYRMLRLLGPSGLGLLIRDLHEKYLKSRGDWLRETIQKSLNSTELSGAANVFLVARR